MERDGSYVYSSGKADIIQITEHNKNQKLKFDGFYKSIRKDQILRDKMFLKKTKMSYRKILNITERN